ncbi:hypothetical protein [Sorangium sp. So ce1078]
MPLAVWLGNAVALAGARATRRLRRGSSARRSTR